MLTSYDCPYDTVAAVLIWRLARLLQRYRCAGATFRVHPFQFALYLLAYYDDYDCFEDYCERYGCDEHCVNDDCEMCPFAAAAGVAGDGGDEGGGVDDIAATENVDYCRRWANGGGQLAAVGCHFGRFESCESYDFWTLCLMTMEMLMMMWIQLMMMTMMGHERATENSCGYCIDDVGYCWWCSHEMASASFYRHSN